MTDLPASLLPSLALSILSTPTPFPLSHSLFLPHSLPLTAAHTLYHHSLSLFPTLSPTLPPSSPPSLCLPHTHSITLILDLSLSPPHYLSHSPSFWLSPSLRISLSLSRLSPVCLCLSQALTLRFFLSTGGFTHSQHVTRSLTG